MAATVVTGGRSSRKKAQNAQKAEVFFFAFCAFLRRKRAGLNARIQSRLVVANSFGKRVLPPESAGRLVVRAGTSLRLRYGVMLFNAPATRASDSGAAYDRFLRLQRST
jgi:hypothetical protein